MGRHGIPDKTTIMGTGPELSSSEKVGKSLVADILSDKLSPGDDYRWLCKKLAASLQNAEKTSASQRYLIGGLAVVLLIALVVACTTSWILYKNYRLEKEKQSKKLQVLA